MTLDSKKPTFLHTLRILYRGVSRVLTCVNLSLYITHIYVTTRHYITLIIYIIYIKHTLIMFASLTNE